MLCYYILLVILPFFAPNTIILNLKLVIGGFYGLILNICTILAQDPALSPRTANYDIKAYLDAKAHKITAKQTLYWTNPSDDTIRSLQFHLYYNAFKNTESTFLRERNDFPSFLKNSEEDCLKWAWLEVQKMVDEYGNDLTPTMHYIQPDDGNEFDQTVLNVPLKQAVLPHESIKIDMDWESKIPNIAARTGYNKEYYFMAQWFPKVGVYEPAGTRFAEKGQWNCHQYHSSGEYYADFGVYEVAINVPNEYVVGSSGSLIKEAKTAARTTYTYKLEDVIDFTWTASPHFVIQETTWKDVTIKLLTYPHHTHFAERYFRTTKNALEYLDKHIGVYPYKTLTIVDPPIHGLFTGGMEYPTLVSSLSFCFLPKGIKTPETLVTHEFVHQYFMQMVASNEQEEPWLDEGFTTYFEGRILDHYEGEKTSTIDVWGIKAGNIEFNRAEFLAMDNPKIAENNRWSWDYNHGGYGKIAYNKTALWLRTLEGLVGLETMDEIMKTYFERWKFKHPCGQDFFDIVNEIVPKNHGNELGENMDWFFEQVFYGSDICDYSVANIYNQPTSKASGFFEDLDNCVIMTIDRNHKNTYIASFDKDSKVLKNLNKQSLVAQNSKESLFKSEVVLHRLGEVKLPVEIEILFEDGTKRLEKWNGQERSMGFKYVGESKIKSVEIDPEQKIYMDANFLNNSKTVEIQITGIRKYWLQFLVSVQHVMEMLSLLV